MSLKIAIIQPNIGNIDDVKPIPKQSVEFTHHVFTEPQYPLSELSPRMQAKYIKLQHHRFLHGYDVYIYLDGRIEITSSTWVEGMVSKLRNHGNRFGSEIVITKHSERNTVGEEYDFLFKHMNDIDSKAGAYLHDRYNYDALKKESRIIDHSLQLYACGVFAWQGRRTMGEYFDDWWQWCLMYGSFDQCAFSHIVPKTYIIPTDYTGIKVNKHVR